MGSANVCSPEALGGAWLCSRYCVGVSTGADRSAVQNVGEVQLRVGISLVRECDMLLEAPE
jgi:hypothetical protein